MSAPQPPTDREPTIREAPVRVASVAGTAESSATDLERLRQGMRAFVDERDWGRFHDPKSVLLALVGEVGELAEVVQWLPADQLLALAAEEPLRSRLGEEMSDVLLYLVLLADVLGIDLGAAAVAKLAAAHGRYPADPVRARAERR